MLASDVDDGRWWRMLETVYVDDKFEMLMTDLRCWWPSFRIEKVNIIKSDQQCSVTNTLKY